jgi:hypothetical protein
LLLHRHKPINSKFLHHHSKPPSQHKSKPTKFANTQIQLTNPCVASAPLPSANTKQQNHHHSAFITALPHSSSYATLPPHSITNPPLQSQITTAKKFTASHRNHHHRRDLLQFQA